MLAIGHAILGDALYAPPQIAARSPRLLLHANQLELTHPVTAERLTFSSPVPF
jgi:tRNA pseudouridine32 synthase/23S rRNA pseudouridine746 synthase